MMSINRDHFIDSFLEFPPWLCGRCNSGTLSEDKDLRQVLEPGWSERIRDTEDWEPDWFSYRFSAVLRCSNRSCGDIVLISGDATNVQVAQAWDAEEEWIPSFTPKAAYPGIAPIRLDSAWPEPVTDELKRAFPHIWSDPGAAVNRLRVAVERLLDCQSVKKTTVNVRSKRVRISLHDRIEAFKQKNKEAGEFLLAIKWIGNAGSHADPSAVQRVDVLDGLELLEHALHKLYDQTPSRMKRLANIINKKKGPSRR